MAPNRERAERIILEILRQSGGGLGKSLTFKAFWLAHLYYSRMARGYLSDWPIVRMPKGPGIDRGERLIQDLVANGSIRKEYEPKGPYIETVCKLTDKPIDGQLPDEALKAIQAAVEDVKGRNASSVSEWSHDFSRAWNNTPDGQELNIYSDLIPDEEYAERKQELAEMRKAYEDLFE